MKYYIDDYYDSCISLYEKEKVEEILGLDTSKFQVSLLIQLGYRVNHQQSKIRFYFAEVAEFIN